MLNEAEFSPKSCAFLTIIGGPAGVVRAGFLGFEMMPVLLKSVKDRLFSNVSYSKIPSVIP